MAAAVEQRADLLAKKRLAIIDRKFTVGGAKRKRADRSTDENILSLNRITGDLGGAPVDFTDLMIETITSQSDAIRAKAVRFDHLRTGAGVLLINAREEFGAAEVHLLQAMVQRHAE